MTHHHSHMQRRAEGGRFARGGRAGGEEMIGGVPAIGGHPTKLKQPMSQSGHKGGGKVHGHHARHRLDKKARGGRMTPSSPLSGADAPDLPYAKAHMKSAGEGGKGRD